MVISAAIEMIQLKALVHSRRLATTSRRERVFSVVNLRDVMDAVISNLPRSFTFQASTFKSIAENTGINLPV